MEASVLRTSLISSAVFVQCGLWQKWGGLGSLKVTGNYGCKPRLGKPVFIQMIQTSDSNRQNVVQKVKLNKQ